MMRSLIIILILCFTLPVYAQKVSTLKLRDNTVSTIKISHRGGVLNFPSKPSKVVLGNGGHFAVEYINNDLVISPLRSNARSHLFVYVNGRRFNLDIIASSKGFTLIQIRDELAQAVEVPYVR